MLICQKWWMSVAVRVLTGVSCGWFIFNCGYDHETICVQNRPRCTITTTTTRNVCAATRAVWTWRARTRRGRVASRTRSCVISTSRTSRSWNAPTLCSSSAVSSRRVWAVLSPGGKAQPLLFSHCRHKPAPVSKGKNHCSCLREMDSSNSPETFSAIEFISLTYRFHKDPIEIKVKICKVCI
jgi:hypothetical protein